MAFLGYGIRGGCMIDGAVYFIGVASAVVDSVHFWQRTAT